MRFGRQGVEGFGLQDVNFLPANATANPLKLPDLVYDNPRNAPEDVPPYSVDAVLQRGEVDLPPVFSAFNSKRLVVSVVHELHLSLPETLVDEGGDSAKQVRSLLADCSLFGRLGVERKLTFEAADE